MVHYAESGGSPSVTSPQLGEVAPSITTEHPLPEGVSIFEAHGQVEVGPGRTKYKTYFSENPLPGIGIVVPGFGGFLKSSEPLGKAFARAGLNTVVYDPIRYSNSAWEDMTDPQKVHVRTIEAIVRDLPNNPDIIRRMPEGKHVVTEPQVLIPHSMGGLPAPRYALKHHEDVEMIAFLETVGTNKAIGATLLKAVINGDLAGSFEHELAPYLGSDDMEFSIKNALRAARYFGITLPWKHDARISRPIGEALSCVIANTRPALKLLGELGVRRLYIEGGRDVLIQADSDIADHVDKVIKLRAYGHLAPQVKADLIAQTVLEERQNLLAAA